jgi:hypothetical protein
MSIPRKETMTDKQAQALATLRTERAKIKVRMAAHYDNALVQAFGGFVFHLYDKAIARAERKHGLA